MFTLSNTVVSDKTQLYAQLLDQAKALLHGETDNIANAANLASLIWHTLPDLNWVGFYFFRQGELVLGPFMGKPACVRIRLDRGVCGAAARTQKVQIVADVHQFPGHIACDAASRSELVLPLVCHERLLGVLDFDSPIPGRFSHDDFRGLQPIAELWMNASMQPM